MNFITSIFSSSTAQIIMAILGLAAGLGAYITRLRSEVTKHQQTIAQLQGQAQSQQFNDQIKKEVQNVSEDERDYSAAVDAFIKQYGSPDSPANTEPQPSTKSVPTSST